jgi:AcrR family transcriptional regulator
MSVPGDRSGRTTGGEALGSERRREREKEQRRNAILRAARREFFEKGFRSVTVDSIARCAELSKGAIYLYFKSKEEIYAQILLRDIDKFHDRVETLMDTSKSASDNLRQFAEVYTAFFLSDRELFRIFMNFMIQHHPVNFTPRINDHIVKSTNQTVVILEQILQMGIERGEFPRTLDIRVCRNSLWGLLNGIMALHLFAGREETREERVRTQVRGGLEVFIGGLRSI